MTIGLCHALCATAQAMSIFQSELFTGIRERLSWLTERQRVLAENVANANTANYKPRDLAPPTFDAMVKASGRVMPKATHAGHMAMGPSLSPNTVEVKDYSARDIKINGNAVSLEDQMIKVSETAMDYQGMIGLLRKWQNMFKAVSTRV